jgi:hypothetical protein
MSRRLRWSLEDRTLLAAKCAIAAAGAWLLALDLTPSTAPYYAPMAAFLMIQPTVAASVKDSVQYLAAAGLGVVVALGVAMLLDSGAVGIAVTVGTAVLIGGLPWLGAERATVAFWALFVLVVGAGDPVAYVVQQLPDAAIGIAVGVAVNLVLVPPVHLRPADDQLLRLRQDLADVVDAMAGDLSRNWPPEDPRWGIDGVHALAEQSRAAVRQAEESLRWNPRSRRWRQHGQQQRQAADSLEQVTLGVRALSGVLLDAARHEENGIGIPDDARPLLATHLQAIAASLRGAAGDEGRSPSALRDDIVELHHQDPTAWLSEGAVLVQLERLGRAVAALPQPAAA